MHRVLLTLSALLASGAVCAQAQLTPQEKRITDQATHADYKTYEAMQGRIKALNDRGLTATPLGPRVSNYHLSKAQCWLDVSFHEYTRNDRSKFPQEALHQSERLVVGLERNMQPMPMDTPLVNDADRLRPDLWDAAAALRKHAGWRCAEQKAACAEVELVHAGNEHKQQGWRHAKPYVQIAEDLIGEARAAAEACVPPPAPVPPIPPVVQAPPPPAPVLPAPAPVPEKVSLGANILFNFDKHDEANIRPQTRKTLDDLILRLKSGEIEVESIRLIGHADRLTNPAAAGYNQRLSERRAQTVRQILINAGIDANKISIDAKGDSQQVEACKALKQGPELRECLLQNRRVEIQVSGVRRAKPAQSSLKPTESVAGIPSKDKPALALPELPSNAQAKRFVMQYESPFLPQK